MPPSSTIGSKGQMVVPLEIRRRLGLNAGDRVEFVLDGDRAILRPTPAQENPFERHAGALAAFDTKRGINAWVRGLRGAHCARRSQQH